MIIPIFNIDQTQEFVLIDIRAPHADFKTLNVNVEERLFYFSSGSYFLKIELTGDVKTEEESIVMKIDGEMLHFQLEKCVIGDHFPDLDMISKLLITGKKTKGLIEDLSVPEFSVNDELFDWHQKMPTQSDLLTSDGFSFGFASSKNINSSNNLQEDFVLALDITEPHQLSTVEKMKLKEENESEKFSHEHYISDLFLEGDENVHILESLNLTRDYEKKPEFTNDQIHRLTVLTSMRLPLIDEDKRIAVYLGLLDILLAYSFDARMNLDEENSESGWNIVKIAANFSWLLEYYDVKEVIKSFLRRSLCFPMVRNWQLSQCVIQDVVRLLKSPHRKSWILKQLLHCRSILIDYPGFYIFVNLFMDEYIVWLQNCASEKVLEDMAKAIEKVTIKKGDFEDDFGIVHVERLARKILEEERLEAEEKAKEIACEMDKLTIDK